MSEYTEVTDKYVVFGKKKKKIGSQLIYTWYRILIAWFIFNLKVIRIKTTETKIIASSSR